MNCDKCLFLENNNCLLGKHTYLNPFRDIDNSIIKLSHECIFKNEAYKGLNYDLAHRFAKTRIAIAAYFVINNEKDMDKLNLILDKEKDYGENVIGQFNVICNKIDIPLNNIKEMADIFVKSSRLWNIHSLFEDQWENNQYVDAPQFIIDTCVLPYYTIIEDVYQFGEIKTFENYCMSHPMPYFFGNIKRVSTLRKTIEMLTESEENAEFQI